MNSCIFALAIAYCKLKAYHSKQVNHPIKKIIISKCAICLQNVVDWDFTTAENRNAHMNYTINDPGML